jgi:hypothetical protein
MQGRPEIVGLPVKARLGHGLIDRQHDGKHPPTHSGDIHRLVRQDAALWL